MASALRVLQRDASRKGVLRLSVAQLSVYLPAARHAGSQPANHGLDSDSRTNRGFETSPSGNASGTQAVAGLPRDDERCEAIGSRLDLARRARSVHTISRDQSRGLFASNAVTSSAMITLRPSCSQMVLPLRDSAAAQQQDCRPNPSTALRHVALFHSSSAAHFAVGGDGSTGNREGYVEAGAAASAKGTDGSSSSSNDEDSADVKSAVLQAALTHVPALGWSTAALIAGARDRGLSPSVLGLLPRGEAHLVEFFMDKCRRQFEAEFPHTPIAVATASPAQSSTSHSAPHSRSGSSTSSSGRQYEEEDLLALQHRMAAAIRSRLRLQAPYTSSWHQALAIQARPSNACEAVRQRRQLAASMWGAVGVRCSDGELLAYRLLLGSAYASAEVHMLTDFSPDFHDTWQFVDREMDAAFQMKGSADTLVSQACASIPAIRTVLSILSKPPKPSSSQA